MYCNSLPSKTFAIKINNGFFFLDTIKSIKPLRISYNDVYERYSDKQQSSIIDYIQLLHPITSA